MNLFYQPLIRKGIHYLDAEESRHCVKVLRKRKGDTIMITDGEGTLCRAIITNEDTERCSFSIQEERREAQREFFIHIAIAPTKNPDRMEWFVEKATEFGIDQITLLETEHTERTFLKLERLRKVSVSAMKQSLKGTLPRISPLVTMQDVVTKSMETSKFIAYVDESNPLLLFDAAKRGGKYLVLIGPEGDFSKEELTLATAHDFVKVSLGKSRLRTETAGIAACHMLNLLNS